MCSGNDGPSLFMTHQHKYTRTQSLTLRLASRPPLFTLWPELQPPSAPASPLARPGSDCANLSDHLAHIRYRLVIPLLLATDPAVDRVDALTWRVIHSCLHPLICVLASVAFAHSVLHRLARHAVRQSGTGSLWWYRELSSPGGLDVLLRRLYVDNTCCVHQRHSG